MLRDAGGRIAGEQGRPMYRDVQPARLRLTHQSLGDALALRVPERQPLDARQQVVVLGNEAPLTGGVADRETRDEVECLRPALAGQPDQLPCRDDVGGAEGAVRGDPVDVGRGVVDGVDGRPIAARPAAVSPSPGRDRSPLTV